MPGHPDVFLRKYNVAIFIHGCFWHRHPGCKYAYTPKSRVNFWEKKFAGNLKRDAIVKDELTEQGIRQLIVCECTIRKMMKDQKTAEMIMERARSFLMSDLLYLEL